MKTLIIYSSKYGYTRECVEKLKIRLDGEILAVNVKNDKIPDIGGFDNIIVGSSVYMGQINKKLKEYIAQNLGVILQKRAALFICCGLPENLDATLKNAFPEELRQKAVAVECFGGELNTDKMKGLDKIMTNVMKKAAAKEGKPDAKPMPENIEKLANAVNGK